MFISSLCSEEWELEGQEENRFVFGVYFTFIFFLSLKFEILYFYFKKETQNRMLGLKRYQLLLWFYSCNKIQLYVYCVWDK